MPQRNPTASSSSSSEQDADGTKECSPNPNKGFEEIIFGGIGNEILEHILLWLPRESLLSSRLVCTRWLNATTEPSFVRSYRSLNPPMLGFFYHRFNNGPPRFIPTARLPDVKESADRVSSTLDFFPHQDSLRIVDSCGGRLLLADTTKGIFFVCSPMRKEWVEIPYPPSAERETPFLIGLTEKNPSSFQVVRIVKPGERPLAVLSWNYCYYDFEVETFSSETRTWRINRPKYHCNSFRRRFVPDSICSSPMWLYPYSTCIPKPETQTLPVFVGGVLYWISSERRLLAYNTKRSNCALLGIDLPEDMPTNHFNTTCLGKADGRLCYALVNRNTAHLSIWVLIGDYPKLKWTLTHQIDWSRETEVDVPVGMRNRMADFVRPIGFHRNDHNVVFLSNWNKTYSYHLETREMKELSSDGYRPYTLIFPYEMAESRIPMLGTTAGKYPSGH